MKSVRIKHRECYHALVELATVELKESGSFELLQHEMRYRAARTAAKYALDDIVGPDRIVPTPFDDIVNWVAHGTPPHEVADCPNEGGQAVDWYPPLEVDITR